MLREWRVIKLFLFLYLYCVIRIVNPRRIALNIVDSACINGSHLLLQIRNIFPIIEHAVLIVDKNICAALPQSLASNMHTVRFYSQHDLPLIISLNECIYFLVFVLTSGDDEGIYSVISLPLRIP